MDSVLFYIENILKPKLNNLGVSKSFIKRISDVIYLQANSLLRHWDNITFRKTLLLLGLEEGMFYEPKGKTEIKSFVVMVIRNSPIETIQSNSYTQAGMKRIATDKDIKSITSAAITYFNKQDFYAMSSYAKTLNLPDYYYESLRSHPVAADALYQTANSSSKLIDYPQTQVTIPYELSELELYTDNSYDIDKVITSVYDGYAPDLDPMLANILINLSSGNNGTFIVDCFKSVTRNFDKLMDIIEYLLTRGIPFVTANFYFENGHTEQRGKLLRASHTNAEKEYNLNQSKGLGYKHQQVINYFKTISE